MLFGGFAAAAIERVGHFGDGFLGAALPPKHLGGLFQISVALGPRDTVERARRNLLDHYAFTGRADYTADGLPCI